MFHMTVLLCELEDFNCCFLVEACPERTQTFFAFLCIWISHSLSHFRPRIAHRFNWIVSCKRSLMDSLFFAKKKYSCRSDLHFFPFLKGKAGYDIHRVCICSMEDGRYIRRDHQLCAFSCPSLDLLLAMCSPKFPSTWPAWACEILGRMPCVVLPCLRVQMHLPNLPKLKVPNYTDITNWG